MSYVAVAVGGGAVLGLVGSQMASNAQAHAANNANNTQYAEYEQTRADHQPYVQAGYTALNQMQDPYFQQTFKPGNLTQDPGYQFRMQQGMKAIQGSAAARGALNSGGTLKALQGYGQDMATQEYQNAYNRYNNDQSNRFNRLASIAGIGQTANGQVTNAGMNFANQYGQNTMAAGNAQAAGYVGGINAINSGINTGLNYWQGQNLINAINKNGG